MADSVRDLTQRIASGDPAAFASFYESNFDAMYHDARHLTGRDESFCLDVVQDAMMRIIRTIRPMDDCATLRSWLRVVVRTAALDRLRREAAESRRRLGRAQQPPPCSDPLASQRMAWLQDELRRLDPVAHDLLMMRHQLGWTLETIGRTLGLAPSIVHRRLANIVRSLRQRAEESFDG